MIREMKSLINLLHRQVKSCVPTLHFDEYWPVHVFPRSFYVFLQLPTQFFVLIHFLACPLTYRCWELTHQEWLQPPLPSPLTSRTSSTSYSPATSFFNTSSSSATGHTEHFSASNPKSLQYNDSQSKLIISLFTTWLRSQRGNTKSLHCQKGNWDHISVHGSQ